MLSFILSLFLLSPVHAVEIEAESIYQYTSLSDQGPMKYKNLTCSHFLWHKQYVCTWDNRVTKTEHRLNGKEARNLLLVLRQERSLQCSASPWDEVCRIYAWRATCNNAVCRLFFM